MARSIQSPTESVSVEQAATLPRPTFPCFDGLRAIAAVGILVHHTAYASRGALSDTFGPYFAEMNVGVFIFFVISGFLLYYPFARAHLATRPTPGARAFLIRRAGRIYPAYWVALIFGLYLLPAHFIEFTSTKETVLNFLLLQRYTRSANIYAGLPQSWTLVIEVSFYVFVPLYGWALSRIARRAGLRVELAGIALLLAVGAAVQAWSTWGKPWQPLNVLPFYLGVFGLGMLMAVGRAWVDERGETPSWLEWVGRYPLLWWALAAACAVVTVEWLGIPASGTFSRSDAFVKLQLHALLGMFVVLPAVFGPQDRGLIRRGLRLKPMVYLGLISYGIYLWHLTVIPLVRDEWWGRAPQSVGFWQLVIPVFVLTVVVATVSYYVVERPCIDLAHKVSRRVRG
jgi:peptidoglycan/LPS O-acetylase OafA/YrhL